MGSESIPVVKIRNVLMVTMPADPDDATMGTLQEEVLRSMERHEAKGLLIDISAVETLDSFFARTLIETTHMIAMMGGRVVIAGMRPSVAITATQLGLTLGGVTTALDTDRALKLLEDEVPRRVPL